MTLYPLQFSATPHHKKSPSIVVYTKFSAPFNTSLSDTLPQLPAAQTALTKFQELRVSRDGGQHEFIHIQNNLETLSGKLRHPIQWYRHQQFQKAWFKTQSDEERANLIIAWQEKLLSSWRDDPETSLTVASQVRTLQDPVQKARALEAAWGLYKHRIEGKGSHPLKSDLEAVGNQITQPEALLKLLKSSSLPTEHFKGLVQKCLQMGVPTATLLKIHRGGGEHAKWVVETILDKVGLTDPERCKILLQFLFNSFYITSQRDLETTTTTFIAEKLNGLNDRRLLAKMLRVFKGSQPSRSCSGHEVLSLDGFSRAQALLKELSDSNPG